MGKCNMKTWPRFLQTPPIHLHLYEARKKSIPLCGQLVTNNGRSSPCELSRWKWSSRTTSLKPARPDYQTLVPPDLTHDVSKLF